MTEEVVLPVSFFVSIIGTIAFAAVIFAPITQPSPRLKGPRLQIADLFSLIVLWQYGLLTAITSRGGESIHLIFSGLLILVLTALWFGLVTTLSQHGVRNAWRRLVLITFAVPLAILATPVLLLSLMMSLIDLMGGRVGIDIKRSTIALAGCMIAGIASRTAMGWAMGRREPTDNGRNETPVSDD